MKNYTYQNNLVSKKQLRQILGWSFTNFDSMQACSLADELKYLGFKYATKSGISISIEDLRVPFIKNLMLQRANQEILSSEKIFIKGKITEVERFQKIIDTWNITSEMLKDEVVSFFKKYDPLNSVYIMAFSGARGNLSQVRQLVGMRGLMSDSNGEIMNLPIKKNFREGLTVTDYLMSGYGARKGIVDTALKTANSGYLTRRLIDVAQDIIIREKDCHTTTSFLIDNENNFDSEQIIGRVLAKPVYELQTKKLIATANIQITPQLLKIFKQKQILRFHIRSPLTCSLYRSICQMCYGYDLSNQNLVDFGEAIGILAGQSIGEPGTQLTMRTFHTGGIFTSEARKQIISPMNGIIRFSNFLKTIILRTNRGEDVLVTKNSGSLILIPKSDDSKIIQIELLSNTILFVKNNQYVRKSATIGEFINTEKQKLTEKKPILSDTAGEIFIPEVKTKENLITQNRLLWLLFGQVYQVPNNSFLNFYTDYKINKNSYIFRTKLVSQSTGYSKSLKKKKIEIINNIYTLPNTSAQKIINSETKKTYLINGNNSKYLFTLKDSQLENSKKFKKNKSFLVTLSNKFKTLTGGILYYVPNRKMKLVDDFLSYIIPYKTNKILENEKFKLEQYYEFKYKNLILLFRFLKYFLSILSINPILRLKLKKYLEYYKIVSKQQLIKSWQLSLREQPIINQSCPLFLRLREFKKIQSFPRWVMRLKETEFKRRILQYSLILLPEDSEETYKKLREFKRIQSWLREETYKKEIEITSKEKILHNALIWLPEETYKLNCDKNILLAEDGDFISKKFEVIPNLISRTSGVIMLSQKKNIIEEISIKEGVVYQGKHFQQLDKDVYYPGEIIFNKIKIKQPSLCEHLMIKTNSQLLIRPFSIYEIPKEKTFKKIFNTTHKLESILSFNTQIIYSYKRNQKIKTSSSINLISQITHFISKKVGQNNVSFELNNCFDSNCLKFKSLEKLILNHYLAPHLKYQNLQSSLLIEPTQFIDSYTTLGYFESLTVNSLKIVKFKSKIGNKKQILLISNDNCITVEKKETETKTVNELITNNIDMTQIGKVLIDNDKFLTIQKGRPYFFPNCNSETSKEKLDLQYKFFALDTNLFKYTSNNFLNYYDITQGALKGLPGLKVKFSKMFIKKNGKFYSSSIRLFLNNFSLTRTNRKDLQKIQTENCMLTDILINESDLTQMRQTETDDDMTKMSKIDPPVVFKTSELVPAKNKQNFPVKINFNGVRLIDPFETTSIGIHSITEDYFQQDVNNVYCKNGDFIEKGDVIGLLNFEKEITGDIVQGLPRIEELLEARKKKPSNKHMATNQKQSLLIQKSSIDSNFEFQKLGTPIRENDKINPHNLLKVYFTYYSVKKQLNENNVVTSCRLLNNYEASYRAFKKIQLLILNAVQSVYKSQGVSIANKHLEVIIRQMTTKVIITDEGHTGLLPFEVVDLYHIQNMNQIIKANNKLPAYYVPLLLGITTAALNNPSFISAASFQETTRVLTKAAIEGRVDWLRGLKENIIVGHLIPSGTGYQSYTNCFNSITQNKIKINLEKIKM